MRRHVLTWSDLIKIDRECALVLGVLDMACVLDDLSDGEPFVVYPPQEHSCRDDRNESYECTQTKEIIN